MEILIVVGLHLSNLLSLFVRITIKIEEIVSFHPGHRRRCIFFSQISFLRVLFDVYFVKILIKFLQNELVGVFNFCYLFISNLLYQRLFVNLLFIWIRNLIITINVLFLVYFAIRALSLRIASRTLRMMRLQMVKVQRFYLIFNFVGVYTLLRRFFGVLVARTV